MCSIHGKTCALELSTSPQLSLPSLRIHAFYSQGHLLILSYVLHIESIQEIRACKCLVTNAGRIPDYALYSKSSRPPLNLELEVVNAVVEA